MPLNVDKIRTLMKGRTQSEIAKATGMTQPAFARLLAGKISPRLLTVEKIAEALGCRAKDLISEA
jgi:predicted transcriptional regulator